MLCDFFIFGLKVMKPVKRFDICRQNMNQSGERSLTCCSLVKKELETGPKKNHRGSESIRGRRGRVLAASHSERFLLWAVMNSAFCLFIFSSVKSLREGLEKSLLSVRCQFV